MIIKSESGDYFEIPEGQEFEYKQYQQAINTGDEKTMLKFEGGKTGWKYLEHL